MDPDKTLKEALALAHKAERRQLNKDEADELAAKVRDLDAWLRKGGYLPAAWAKRSTP